MDQMNRYAVYYVPPPGPFAERAAAWLGRDLEKGAFVPHPDLPGLPRPIADLTEVPRKYGFHATLRAPFRPAEGVTAQQIATTVAQLATALPPAVCAGLRPRDLHGFIALTPEGDTTGLEALCAEVVKATNPLRAPLTEAEIARRRPDALSLRQRDLLALWGYPFVMDEFQFHLTLTGPLDGPMMQGVLPVVQSHFAPVLPRPFVVRDLCVVGEDAAGRFHLISRHALTG